MTPHEATQHLFQAVTVGDRKAASAAIDAGADINARNQWQETPVLLAARSGHTEIVHMLQLAMRY